MDKYIRTKNGVYEVKSVKCITDTKYIDGTPTNIEPIYDYKTNYTYDILSNEVFGKADTIEELCDTFVMISEDYDLPQLVCKMNFEYCKTKCKWTNFYGAVWTEEGLIYVAKMDNEGKLVLL